MNEKWTTNDVARALNVAPATVYYYCRLGRLKADRTKSGIRLFDRVEVERFAKSRKQTKGRNNA